MHLDSGSVAKYLEDFAPEYGGEEGPCAESDSKEYLDDEDKGEYGEVEGVSGERGDIVDLGPVNRACLQGAEVGVVVESCICVQRGGVAHLK